MNKLTAWGVEGIGEIVPGDQVGDIIEVSQRSVTVSQGQGAPKSVTRVVLDQTPEIEGAVVLLDPS
ncbi:MAG: hypothetical protein EBR53_09510, partial [Actinobacteria bacterium]|nr:hypothetical protein [Actinomycetota bacterium]